MKPIQGMGRSNRAAKWAVVLALTGLIAVSLVTYGQRTADRGEGPFTNRSLPPRQAQGLVPTGRVAGDLFLAMAVRGPYAFATERGVLLSVYDISRPEDAQKIAYLVADASLVGQQVVLSGNTALVLSVAEGSPSGGAFSVVDISNPSRPQLLSQLSVTPDAVVVSGHYAYLGSGRLLKVVNLSDPRNPVVEREVPLTGRLEGDGGLAVTNRLYLCEGTAGLSVWDLSNPGHPVRLGILGNIGVVRSVVVSGTYAFVSAGAWNNPPAQGAIRVVNVANPSQMSVVAEVPIGNNPWFPLILSGNILYAGDFDTERLFILDVSRPTAPAVVSQLRNRIPLAHDPASRRLLAGGHYEFHTYDVTNPAAPDLVGTYPSIGPLAVAVERGFAFCAEQDAVAVYDVRDPAAPRRIAFYPLLSNATGNPRVLVSGSRVIVSYLFGRSGNVFIFDATSAPVLNQVGTYSPDTFNTYGIAVSGDILLVAHSNGYDVVNLSGTIPTRMFRGSLDGGAFATDVAVQGNLAFLTTSDRRLVVLNAADPAAPSELGSLSLSFLPADVEVLSSLVAVAGDGDLAIVDVSDPQRPHQIAFWDNPQRVGIATRVRFWGTFAVLSYYYGLKVFDLGRLPQLTPVASLDGASLDAAPFGEFLAVASGYGHRYGLNLYRRTVAGGFVVVDVSPRSGPAAAGVELSVLGDGFQNGATFSLMRNGSVLPATNVTFVSSQRLTGIVNLTGQPEGSVWDVIVRNPDGSEARKNQVFTVLTRPALSSVTPTTVYPRQETIVLDGNHFLEGVAVAFQPPRETGLPLIRPLSISRESDRRIRATFDFSGVAPYFNDNPSTDLLTGEIIVRNPNNEQASLRLSVRKPLRLTSVDPSELALLPGETPPPVTLTGSFLPDAPLTVRLVRSDRTVDGNVLSHSSSQAQVSFPQTLAELEGQWVLEVSQLSVKAEGSLSFREFMKVLNFTLPQTIRADRPGPIVARFVVADVGPGLSAAIKRGDRQIAAEQVEVSEVGFGYQVSATFQVGLGDLGSWDLVLRRPDGRSRTYERAINIVPFVLISEVSFDSRFLHFDRITVKLRGTWLVSGTRVRLVPPEWARVSESAIEPERIVYSDDGTQIEAVFSLFDKIAPAWFGFLLQNFSIPVTITVDLPGDLPDQEAHPPVTLETPAFIVEFIGPSRIRMGREETYTLTINNHGNLPDTPFVILSFDLQPAEGAQIRYQVVDQNGQVEAEGVWKPGDPERGFSLNPHGGWTLGSSGFWSWRSHSVRVRVVPTGEPTGPQEFTIRPTVTVISTNFLRSFVARQARQLGTLRSRSAFRGILIYGIKTEMASIEAEDPFAFPPNLDYDQAAQKLADDFLSQYDLIQDLKKEATDLALSQAGSAAFKAALLKKFPNLSEEVAEEGAGILMDVVKGSKPEEILLGWIISKAGQASGLGIGLDILSRLMKVAMTHSGKYVQASEYARQVLAQTVQQQSAQAPVVRSWDPNAKDGPAGIGGFLSARDTVVYRVLFENLATASAAAEEVLVEDTLDPNLDPTTLSFLQFGFGSHIRFLPENTREINEDVTVRDDLVVQVRSAYDPVTRKLTVRFRGINPRTGQHHPDGFLPPNQNPPEGDGFVLFQIKTKADVPSGTVIRNRAVITFDPHLEGATPLATNEHALTLDSAPPVVQLTGPPLAAHPYFTVTWDGDDQHSGLSEVQLWVSDDGGPYRLWKLFRPESRTRLSGSDLFTGRFGHQYRFYAVSVDRVGNQTPIPETPPLIVSAGRPPDLPSGLRLLTIPVESEEPDPIRVIPFEENRWVWYDTTSGQYVRYPDRQAARLEVGKGFWTRLTTPVRPSVKGAVPDPSRPFVLPVKRGWNLIGNPWLTPLPWDTSAIAFRKNGVSKLLKDLAPGEGVEPYVWRWDGSHYRFVFDQSVLPGVEGQLPPWEGCWLWAHTDGELVLGPSTGRRSRLTSRSQRNGSGWTATLTAESGGQTSQALIGVTDGKRLRVVLPPDPPEQSSDKVRLTILSKDGHHSQADLRTEPNRVQEWEIVVAWNSSPSRGAPASSPITLTWDGIGYAPKDLTFTLIDRTTGVKRYLRTQTHYRFVPEEGEGERRFTLIAEPGNQRPLRIVGLRAVPTRGGTLIEFVLTRPATVTAEVLSLTGRKITVLPVQGGTVSGNHRVVWHNSAEDGRRLSPGVYLIRVVAADEEGRMVQGTTLLRTSRVR
ncbi:MAG: hypothetical protein NZ959_08915 [Armatimonadetes bacterium]|nr:hypothetical protein [Armatimonadota bacterium]MDW8121796.1 hypothetical protein [Armatimonadota bacterium]